jgi:hypothetical protein
VKFNIDEGLVSKRLHRRFRAGRSPDWIKVKNPTSPAMHRAKEAFQDDHDVDTRKQLVGDVDHLNVFANPDLADEWFK